MALLATLLLFALASAALTEARAHGIAHAAPTAQAKVAVHSTGLAADCMPERPGCQATAHAACCGMAGCSAPVTSLA